LKIRQRPRTWWTDAHKHRGRVSAPWVSVLGQCGELDG
jgi:hypothetical protein